MSFVVTGLPVEPFAALFGLDEAALSAAGALPPALAGRLLAIRA